jgi:hypothetical protein
VQKCRAEEQESRGSGEQNLQQTRVARSALLLFCSVLLFLLFCSVPLLLFFSPYCVTSRTPVGGAGAPLGPQTEPSGSTSTGPAMSLAVTWAGVV